MMDEIDKLKKALIEADRKGDVEAANLFAEKIKGLQRKEEVTPAPTQYSMPAEIARSAVGGLTLGFIDELEAALRSGHISGKQYEAIRNDLRAKQKQFALENPKTALASEIGGGLVMPGGALKLAAKAPSILKSTVIGAGTGGVQGIGQSTNTENLAGDVLTGASIGGGGAGVLGTLGAAVSPILQKGARELQELGVPMTPGTAFGGQVQGVEQAAESLPFVGKLIQGARHEQFEAFNKAALNRALSAIDNTIKVPKDLPLREATDFTYKKISDSYNKIYPNAYLSLDKTLDSQLNALERRHALSTLGTDGAAQFKAQINEIRTKFASSGVLSGGQVKALKEDLGKLTKEYRASTGSEKLLGDAFDDLENSVMLAFRHQNPKYAKDLKKADTAYATYKRVENAAAATKGADTAFTPAQLEAAVKSGNKSQYARGKALLQDLSNTGYDVLGNKLPDSGTVSRAGIASVLTGGAYGFVDPATAAATAFGSGVYTNAGMKYLMPLLTKERSAMTQKYAPSLRAAAPYVPQAFNPLFRGLLYPEDEKQRLQSNEE